MFPPYGAPWRCGVLTTEGGTAGIGLGHLLGREHDSTPQSGLEAPRLLKRSLRRLYYYCCCCRSSCCGCGLLLLWRLWWLWFFLSAGSRRSVLMSAEIYGLIGKDSSTDVLPEHLGTSKLMDRTTTRHLTTPAGSKPPPPGVLLHHATVRADGRRTVAASSLMPRTPEQRSIYAKSAHFPVVCVLYQTVQVTSRLNRKYELPVVTFRQEHGSCTVRKTFCILLLFGDNQKTRHFFTRLFGRKQNLVVQHIIQRINWYSVVPVPVMFSDFLNVPAMGTSGFFSTKTFPTTLTPANTPHPTTCHQERAHDHDP